MLFYIVSCESAPCLQPSTAMADQRAVSTLQTDSKAVTKVYGHSALALRQECRWDQWLLKGEAAPDVVRLLLGKIELGYLRAELPSLRKYVSIEVIDRAAFCRQESTEPFGLVWLVTCLVPFASPITGIHVWPTPPAAFNLDCRCLFLLDPCWRRRGAQSISRFLASRSPIALWAERACVHVCIRFWWMLLKPFQWVLFFVHCGYAQESTRIGRRVLLRKRPGLKQVKKWNFEFLPHTSKNFLWDLRWHRRKFLAKWPSRFWEKSHFVRSRSTIREDRESHFATNHALLAKLNDMEQVDNTTVCSQERTTTTQLHLSSRK